jgi:hypothetical protein
MGAKVLLERLDERLSAPVERRAWTMIAFVLAVVAVVAGVNGAHDPVLFHHLALGRRILADGLHGTGDPILVPGSSSPGPLPYWLGSVALYLAEAIGGRGAVLVLAATAVGIAWVAAWADALGEGPTATWRDVALALPVALLALAVAREHAGPRPEVLALAPLGLTALAARRYAGGRGRELLLFPLLAAVWANVDGSVLLGVAVVAATAVESARRTRRGGEGAPPRRRALELGALAVAGLLATLASPWPGAAAGAALRWAGALAALGRQGPPLGLAAELGTPAIALLVVAVASLAAAGTARPADFTIASLGALLAISLPRGAPFAALLLAPAVVRSLRELPQPRRARAARWLLPLSLCATLAATDAVVGAPGVELQAAPHYELEPVRATDALGVLGFTGPVHAPPRLGAYLAWRLGVRVPADTRPGPWLAPPTEGAESAPDAPGLPVRFDAVVVALAPGTTQRPDACTDGPPIDPAQFALAGYDDGAMLFVRRGGVLAALARDEYRLDPCRAISLGELRDPGWLLVFRAEMARLVLASPQCAICSAGEALALLAGGGAPAFPAGTSEHPTMLRLRAAAHALSEAISADAMARLDRGDVSGAISACWRAIAAEDSARSRATLAFALIRIDERAAALAAARQAVRLDPLSPDARRALAIALRAARGGGDPEDRGAALR